MFIKNSRTIIRKLLFPAGSGGASAHIQTEHQAGLGQAGNLGSLWVLRVGVIPVLDQLAAVRADTPMRQRVGRAHLGEGAAKAERVGEKPTGSRHSLARRAAASVRTSGKARVSKVITHLGTGRATGEAVTVEHQALAQLTGPGRRVLSCSGFGARCPPRRCSDSD